MMEASLILHLEEKRLNIEHNLNWTTSCDYGGEGPKGLAEAHLEHYVYLAVKPLPQIHGGDAAAASAHQQEDAAAASAHQQEEATAASAYQDEVAD